MYNTLTKEELLTCMQSIGYMTATVLQNVEETGKPEGDTLSYLGLVIEENLKGIASALEAAE